MASPAEPAQPSCQPPSDDTTARRVVNKITAMVAYWDAGQRCRFSNDAHREWFGRRPEEMDGISLSELLGPYYERNLPYIQGALAGIQQVFERPVILRDGSARDLVITYTPDLVDGAVAGFSVHVSDVTRLRQREKALAETIREVITTLEKTKDSFRSKELGVLRQRLEAVLERLSRP